MLIGGVGAALLFAILFSLGVQLNWKSLVIFLIALVVVMRIWNYFLTKKSNDGDS
jgi:uncharacterized membrane protein